MKTLRLRCACGRNLADVTTRTSLRREPDGQWVVNIPSNFGGAAFSRALHRIGRAAIVGSSDTYDVGMVRPGVEVQGRPGAVATFDAQWEKFVLRCRCGRDHRVTRERLRTAWDEQQKSSMDRVSVLILGHDL